MPILIALCVFIAVTAGVMAIIQARAATKLVTQARLERVSGQGTYADWMTPQLALKGNRISSLAWLERALADVDFARGLALTLTRADWNLRVSELLALCALSGVLGLGLGALLLGRLPLGILFGALAGFLPIFLARRAAKKRLGKIDAQLEETLVMMSNALKAGFGLMQAVDQAARQLDPPIADELRRWIRDTQVGSSVEQAVLDFGERIGGANLDIVVTAILIQRNVGGNLSEILDGVAHTIRERNRIKREILTLTAEMRASGLVIGLIPPAIGVLLYVINPDYMKILFTDSIGHIMLGASLVMEGIGLFVIRRIMSIEV